MITGFVCSVGFTKLYVYIRATGKQWEGNEILKPIIKCWGVVPSREYQLKNRGGMAYDEWLTQKFIVVLPMLRWSKRWIKFRYQDKSFLPLIRRSYSMTWYILPYLTSHWPLHHIRVRLAITYSYSFESKTSLNHPLTWRFLIHPNSTPMLRTASQFTTHILSFSIMTFFFMISNINYMLSF